MKRVLAITVLFVFVSFSAAFTAPINQVAYGTLTGTELITFDDVAGGSAPGTNSSTISNSNNQ